MRAPNFVRIKLVGLLRFSGPFTKEFQAEGVRLVRERSLRFGLGKASWRFPSRAGTALDHNNVAKAYKVVAGGGLEPPTFAILLMQYFCIRVAFRSQSRSRSLS